MHYRKFPFKRKMIYSTVKLITGIDDNGKNTKLLFFFLSKYISSNKLNQIYKTAKFDTTDKKRYTVSNKYL